VHYLADDVTTRGDGQYADQRLGAEKDNVARRRTGDGAARSPITRLAAALPTGAGVRTFTEAAGRQGSSRAGEAARPDGS
jgi:hypothetical protein